MRKLGNGQKRKILLQFCNILTAFFAHLVDWASPNLYQNASHFTLNNRPYRAFLCFRPFLLNVRKVGRFSQNFVQKMMQKVSAVNFCTPHQLSKTRLAPSCSAFDAKHSVISIESSVLTKTCDFFEFLLRERPAHSWRKFEKSQSFRLASRTGTVRCAPATLIGEKWGVKEKISPQAPSKSLRFIRPKFCPWLSRKKWPKFGARSGHSFSSKEKNVGWANAKVLLPGIPQARR